MISVLIVDDEPIARRRIRRLLRTERDVAVVGECGSGAEALAEIQAHAPDIVFLDVQMPGLDGFDVLAALPPAHPPAVIFTTAYDEYAVRAFDVNAVDYLLKPFTRDRLLAAVRRARAALEARSGIDPRLSAMLEALWAARERPDRLLVKDAGRIYFVRLDEVDWIEAAGNYVRVHVGQTAHLVRETMSALVARLDPRRFVRIHRSAIVNVDRIREIQPWFRGDHIVILENGSRLTLSRTFRDSAHALRY